MVRKVMAGAALLHASGTVTRKLAELGWSAWVLLALQVGRWRLLEIGFVYP